MSKNKIEFGDFQTPTKLARKICLLLRRIGVCPTSVVEPTCGTGNFLRMAIEEFPESRDFIGFEINPKYVKIAQQIEKTRVSLVNFFAHNWVETFNEMEGDILVIGNPPWVTNSQLSSIGSDNLPNKSNFYQLNGIEAITGKSNFDISEWMIIQLLQSLSGRTATLAMLCKTTVARKVLRYSWQQKMQLEHAAMYLIDSNKYFSTTEGYGIVT